MISYSRRCNHSGTGINFWKISLLPTILIYPSPNIYIMKSLTYDILLENRVINLSVVNILICTFLVLLEMGWNWDIKYLTAWNHIRIIRKCSYFVLLPEQIRGLIKFLPNQKLLQLFNRLGLFYVLSKHKVLCRMMNHFLFFNVSLYKRKYIWPFDEERSTLKSKSSASFMLIHITFPNSSIKFQI